MTKVKDLLARVNSCPSQNSHAIEFFRSLLELERSVVQSDNTLASFNGITSSANQIGANVYNAAVLVSPLQSPTATPRFLLLGGQTFSATPPGALSSTVYYNNAPYARVES